MRDKEPLFAKIGLVIAATQKSPDCRTFSAVRGIPAHRLKIVVSPVRVRVSPYPNAHERAIL
jgi:hypothetical protein